VIQSQIPEIALLFMIFSNLVTVARVSRNPTVKEELHQKGLEKNIPLGFFSYPISQAADIAIFKATVVPVGDDQVPMIEQTNELVRRFNHVYGQDVLVEATALVPKVGRLPGIDGKTKMSKSLKNDITLKATREEIEYAVKMMFTDPNHVHVSNPGQVEGNVVFSYLDAFDPDKDEVAILKAHYQKGGLGDSQIKKRLNAILQDFLGPIRERRRYFEAHPEEVIDALEYGTYQAQKVASSTIQEVKHAMGLDDYYNKKVKKTYRTDNPLVLG
jgi:tryptophanyl-tRNA synthetase